MDEVEEPALQVNHLIPFIQFRYEGCFNGFQVIKYAYLAYFEFCPVVCLSYILFVCFLWFTGRRRSQNPFYI